jgi:hypothetical protein
MRMLAKLVRRLYINGACNASFPQTLCTHDGNRSSRCAILQDFKINSDAGNTVVEMNYVTGKIFTEVQHQDKGEAGINTEVEAELEAEAAAQ